MNLGIVKYTKLFNSRSIKKDFGGIGMDDLVFDKYEKSYSEPSFWEKIRKTAQKLGADVIYIALILYYALQSPSTPVWAKTVIIGALGYFVSPIDIIPDITPGVGHTDDVAVMVFAIGAVAMSINEEIRKQARNKLREWFPDFDLVHLKKVDDNIDKKRARIE
jgi:uncharacterized membrane protein YkvA (DUF1232 family)